MLRKTLIPLSGHFHFLESTAKNFDVLIIRATPSWLFFIILDITEIYFALSIKGQVNEYRDIEIDYIFRRSVLFAILPQFITSAIRASVTVAIAPSDHMIRDVMLSK